MIYSMVRGEFSRFWNYDSTFEQYDDNNDYIVDHEAIDEEDDDDYALDSYDEWEFKVEELRDQVTDIDEDEEDIEFYNYLEDDDDQTFVIDNGDEDLEENDDDGDDEEDDDDEEVEDISKLIEESSKDIKHWFDQQT